MIFSQPLEKRVLVDPTRNRSQYMDTAPTHSTICGVFRELPNVLLLRIVKFQSPNNIRRSPTKDRIALGKKL